MLTASSSDIFKFGLVNSTSQLNIISMRPPILQFTSNEKYTKCWNHEILGGGCGPIEGISTYTNNLSRWTGLKIVSSSQQLQSTQIVNRYFNIRIKIQKLCGVEYQADHRAAGISLQMQPFPHLIISRFLNLEGELHLSKGPSRAMLNGTSRSMLVKNCWPP